MKRIYNIGKLYGMVHELLVETVCPKCKNILISTMSQAEMILVFGCQYCADIDRSMLTDMKTQMIEILPKEAMAECTNN